LIVAPERNNSPFKLLTAVSNLPGNSQGATKNFGLPKSRMDNVSQPNPELQTSMKLQVFF
jgi:hypothetical protein